MSEHRSFSAMQRELSDTQRKSNKKSQIIELLLEISNLRNNGNGCYYLEHILNGCVSEIEKFAKEEGLI